MHPVNWDKTIKLIARSDINVRSGDFVYISVIKRLTDNKWALGYKGRVFSAYSDVELAPGQRIRVQVLEERGRILLKLQSKETGPVDSILKQLGESGQLARAIVTALLINHQKITPKIVDELRRYFKKRGYFSNRRLSLLNTLIKKGFNIFNRETENIMSYINYGDEESREKRKKNLRDIELKDLLKRSVENEGEDKDINLLQFYNIKKSGSEDWIIIPYEYREKETDYRGTVRLLFDHYQRKFKKFILFVNKALNPGELKIFFCLSGCEKHKKLQIFSNHSDIIQKKRDELENLYAKLNNYGIKCDDTIYDEQNFDGLNEESGDIAYQQIDTVM